MDVLPLRILAAPTEAFYVAIISARVQYCYEYSIVTTLKTPLYATGFNVNRIDALNGVFVHEHEKSYSPPQSCIFVVTYPAQEDTLCITDYIEDKHRCIWFMIYIQIRVWPIWYAMGLILFTFLKVAS